MIIGQESQEVQNSLYEKYMDLINNPVVFEEIPAERGKERKLDLEYEIRTTIVKVTQFLETIVSIFHKFFSVQKYVFTKEENNKFASTPAFNDLILDDIKFELAMIHGVDTIDREKRLATCILEAEILIYNTKNPNPHVLPIYTRKRCACDYCRLWYSRDIDYYYESENEWDDWNEGNNFHRHNYAVRSKCLNRSKSGFDLRISLHKHLETLNKA